ncbi:MAG: hypothetical protein WCX14_05945, partial [Dysgonamonadaceae bacterium]
MKVEPARADLFIIGLLRSKKNHEEKFAIATHALQMRASEIHQWSTHEYRPYIKTDRMDYFTQLISHNPY